MSSLFDLKLSEINIIECKAHEVDFRQIDLSSANLAYTDFAGSQFVQTNLSSADLSEAQHYQIDVNENNIKKPLFLFLKHFRYSTLLILKFKGIMKQSKSSNEFEKIDKLV